MVNAIDTALGWTEHPDKLIAQIWAWLEQVCDPEIPVLSVLDLGVVRSITLQTSEYDITSTMPSDVPSTHGHLPSRILGTIIHITPTYTGCPAMNMISANIRLELLAHGLDQVQVVEVLSPAWTTDWMTDSGKQKLLEYGIAPPQNKARMDKMLFSEVPVPCPQCGSAHTELISEFGSTACKSLHRCLDCREPFDAFKCH